MFLLMPTSVAYSQETREGIRLHSKVDFEGLRGVHSNRRPIRAKIEHKTREKTCLKRDLLRF